MPSVLIGHFQPTHAYACTHAHACTHTHTHTHTHRGGQWYLHHISEPQRSGRHRWKDPGGRPNCEGRWPPLERAGEYGGGSCASKQWQPCQTGDGEEKEESGIINRLGEGGRKRRRYKGRRRGRVTWTSFSYCFHFSVSSPLTVPPGATH